MPSEALVDALVSERESINDHIDEVHSKIPKYKSETELLKHRDRSPTSCPVVYRSREDDSCCAAVGSVGE